MDTAVRKHQGNGASLAGRVTGLIGLVTEIPPVIAHQFPMGPVLVQNAVIEVLYAHRISDRVQDGLGAGLFSVDQRRCLFFLCIGTA